MTVAGRDFMWPKWDRVCAHSVYSSAVAQVEEAVNMTPYRRVAVQAGGNCGVFAWLLSRDFGWVYTVEPEIGNFKYLMKNIEDRDNIIPMFGALGLTGDACELRLGNKANCGDFRTVQSNHGHIPVYAIDDFIRQPLDLIYLDVQGDEFEVLKGAEGSIMEYHPTIVFEWAPGKADHRGDTEGFMEDLGYSEKTKVKLDRYWTYAEQVPKP